jgi:hypothetical protein
MALNRTCAPRSLRPVLVAVLSLTGAIAASIHFSSFAQSGGTATSTAAHGGVALETSDNCLACHNGLVTPAGEDVSIGVSWRASMMANSSRDPYWQASVRRETMDHPSKRTAIEDECAVCHMPMARVAARQLGREAEVFKWLSATGPDRERQLAIDGVSCTLCHQIGADRLGTRESFVGGFMLAEPGAAGPRMFGPYAIEHGPATVMRSATGARPEVGDHLRSSEVCATCHTLYTNALNEKGEVIGSLPEQVPYLEWQHSAFAGQRTCQSCHMPDVEATPISSVLGKPRERLARHTFVGGNFFVLSMLNANRRELGVVAPAPELEAARHATLRQLETATATIAIPLARRQGAQLDVEVVVRNLTGHKLPTGYPSRRVWIHLTVRDSSGRAIFESGAIESSGAIDGNDNDADPSRLEAHYREISRADQVQIYESVMGDGAGTITTGLLRATSFVKDNRLLPRGFDKRTAARDIAVRGAAQDDEDFTGDGDRVRYLIDGADAAGPLTIEAELRFQPIGFRWADNLRRYDATEPRRFVSYYDKMAAQSSAVLARTGTIVR